MIASNWVVMSAKKMRSTMAAPTPQKMTLRRCSTGTPAAGGAPSSGGTGVTLIPDDRTGQVIVIAPKARAQDVADLIAGVDKPLELATKVYRLKQTSPERIDRLVKNLIGAAAAKRGYQSTIDREAQILVVSASEDVHARI